LELQQWWQRAHQVGWDAARAEHKAQGGRYIEWRKVSRHRERTDN
jgi:hypothetical protein